MKFTISNDKTKLGIDVVTRKYPYSESYWDVNWLTCKINADIPGYSASFYGEIRADEINEFYNQLKEMDQNSSEHASLVMKEDYLHIEVRKDQLGHLEWGINTSYPPHTGATLTFEMKSDQTYLPNILQEMEQVVEKFPIIEGKR